MALILINNKKAETHDVLLLFYLRIKVSILATNHWQWTSWPTSKLFDPKLHLQSKFQGGVNAIRDGISPSKQWKTCWEGNSNYHSEETQGKGWDHIFLSLEWAPSLKPCCLFIFYFQPQFPHHGEKPIWLRINFLYYRLPWPCLFPIVYSCWVQENKGTYLVINKSLVHMCWESFIWIVSCLFCVFCRTRISSWMENCVICQEVMHLGSELQLWSVCLLLR